MNRGGAPGRGAALVVALAAILPTDAAAQTVAAAGPTAGLDVRCEIALRGWTAGDAGVASMATFGARLASPAPSSGRGDEEAPTPLSLSLGTSALGSAGPSRAGAMEADGAGGYLYPGPRPSADGHMGVRTRLDGVVASLAVSLDVSVGDGRPSVRALGVGRTSRRVPVWVGALPLRSGTTCRDGLVLGGGGGPAWGVEAAWTEGIALPLLGRLRLATQLGWMTEGGPGNRHPLLHVLRLEIVPHPDLVVGLQRASIFGGSASPVAVTPRTVGLMLLGITDTQGKDSDFENQVASVDIRWRGALGGRPLLLTAEYGADDSGYAFLKVPGVRLTASTRRGPHPRGWVGVELVHMADPRDRYPSWYRHGALAWGWTDRGTLLGSPLGGQGTLAAASWSVATRALGVEVLAGMARRGPQNLMAQPGGDRVSVGRASLTLDRGPWELSAVGLRTGGIEPAWRGWVSLVRTF